MCLLGGDLQKITTVGFDADDTLWHNERFFRLSQDSFAELIGEFAEPDHLNERLLAAEKRNLLRYGFGIKGFVLSMIETAIEVTDSQVPVATIGKILDLGHEMLAHPIDLLPHAAESVSAVAQTHRVILITKGDLMDQERKLAQSGLGELFQAVEIVSDKTPDRYRRIFERHGDGSDRGMMIGNSVKSDVTPMLQAGGWGVHVPHELVWDLEHADLPADSDRFRQLPTLAPLPELLREIG
ncbi:HAD family hydrolase [Heliomarina baculiformis]|uniref:HAD family hydrolase n=1 Tax=Heliomarina baculiformis TaxID=2872036 RepID=UPI001EE1F644|nr:HAD family hydrolase [Heliomarina baculiformis]